MKDRRYQCGWNSQPSLDYGLYKETLQYGENHNLWLSNEVQVASQNKPSSTKLNYEDTVDITTLKRTLDRHSNDET